MERPTLIHIRRSLEIDAPLSEVYAAWTAFEAGLRLQRLDWTASVDLQPLGERRTRVAFRLSGRPKGWLSTIECGLGLCSTSVDRALLRFKTSLETRQHVLARRELQRVELDRFRALL